MWRGFFVFFFQLTILTKTIKKIIRIDSPYFELNIQVNKQD